MAFDFDPNRFPKQGGGPSNPPYPPHAPSGSSGGFKSMPKAGPTSPYGHSPSPAPSSAPHSGSAHGGNNPHSPMAPVQPSRRQRSVNRGPRQSVDIPWRLVISVLCIIGLMVFLWVFRAEISSFLSQVVSWLLTIAIVGLLIKWFIFR